MTRKLDEPDAEVTRAVASFYERHPFPGERQPDADGLLLMRRVASMITDVRREAGLRRLRLLDAGCGTGNTSVALARTFPALDVQGMDICGRSLDLARAAARDAGLENVAFAQGDLLAGPLPDGPWDIIVCLGVVHHTADMERALGHLAQALALNGRMILWVYGRHGRYHHQLNRRLLELLLKDETDPTRQVDLAREFALDTSDGEPLGDLYGLVPGRHEREQVVLNDAWIADQFLHINERSVDLPEFLGMLQAVGLVMHEWLGEDTSGTRLPPALAARLDRLPEQERLCALDLLLKPRRYFVEARRKGGRPS